MKQWRRRMGGFGKCDAVPVPSKPDSVPDQTTNPETGFPTSDGRITTATESGHHQPRLVCPAD